MRRSRRMGMACLLAAIWLGVVPRVLAQTYTNLHSFAWLSNEAADACGALLPWGSTLLGMSHLGGNSGLGVVFKLGTDGRGYTNLYHFGVAAGSGSQPLGRVLQAPGGKVLYGLTSQGGIGSGVVFRVLVDGTGYANLHYFAGGVADGAKPLQDLTLYGSKLFGMTQLGGSNNKGVIFCLNTDGSGYTILHHFTGWPDGAHPLGSLTLDGSALFGMTCHDGLHGCGTVFKINADGSSYTNLHHFGSSVGGCVTPGGSLVLCGTQ